MNIAASARKAAAAAWRPARNWHAAWRTKATACGPGSAFAPEYAELEDLPGTPRGRVLVPLRVDQLERGAKRSPQARAVIAGDRQAAALFRPVEREGGDDGVPADFQAASEARDIGDAVFLVGEKVERRPVVPDVVSLHRLPDRGICHQPLDSVGVGSEASLGSLQRRARQIEHSDILKPPLDEMVDQSRRAAANIDDGRTIDGTRLHDQFERRRRALLKPADLVLALCRVDVFPMGLTAGVSHKPSPPALIHGRLSRPRQRANEHAVGERSLWLRRWRAR